MVTYIYTACITIIPISIHISTTLYVITIEKCCNWNCGIRVSVYRGNGRGEGGITVI